MTISPLDDSLSAAAAQGHPPAQCSLGFSYERGRGVAIDYFKAADLYAAAAKAGHAQAQQNFGYLLENGLGVENPAEAVFAGIVRLRIEEPRKRYRVAWLDVRARGWRPRESRRCRGVLGSQRPRTTNAR